MREETFDFESTDRFRCNLIRVRGETEPTKGPVILVHGAGVRANIFRPPVPTTFVDVLVADGYDVWLENWRASIDFDANEWTLDQAALYDHPAAVQKIVKETGAKTVKAVVHCQGSTSFMMSAVAGLLPEVDVIVSNAVSLHPVVSWISHQKSRYAVPALSLLTKYMDPRWGVKAEGVIPNILKGLVNLTHHECGNGVCKFTSFTYGTGFPVLWPHENLSAAVHDWISEEFANVPMSFFRQMRRCLDAGHLVSAQASSPLPASLVSSPPKTSARIVFVAGEINNCFSWTSQQRSYDWFEAHRSDYHSLHVFGGYGHLDVFIGKDAARDTFPVMLAALNR